MLPVVLANTKPMTRREIAGLVREIERYHQSGGSLSRAEAEQLEFLQDEFREELQALRQQPAGKPSDLQKVVKHRWIDPWLPDAIYANGRNLLFIEHDPLRIYWDPVFKRNRLWASADTLSGQERVFEDTNGFVMWGTVGEHFGFVTDVRDTKEWGSRAYPGRRNMSREGLGFAQTSGDHLYHDETVASLVYLWKYFTLQFGKDSNRWGPGFHGQLGLSDRATSYDLLKFQVTATRIKFTSMLAWLQHYTPDYFYGDHQEKAMAAHRLEFAPVRQLDIGLYETVIFAGRRFEPAYMNPFMFFRSAEHYLGDRDNVAMGLDFELKIFPKTKLYGELFIDDVTTGKLGTGFYGNKYAYLLGATFVDPFLMPDMTVRVEYTRIRPYTYTHKVDLTAYRHFSTNLGHWSGPNSDDLFVQLEHQHSRRLRLAVAFESRRHGANPPGENIGGDIFHDHSYPQDPDYVDFLAGIRERSNSIFLSASYELVRNGFARIFYLYNHGESAERDFPGKRAEVALCFSLNY